MNVEMWTDCLGGFPFQVTIKDAKVTLQITEGRDTIRIFCCVADLIDLTEKIELLLTKRKKGETAK